MRDLLFLFNFDFIEIKGNLSSPRYCLLISFTLLVKCLECKINFLLHSLSGGASNPGFFLWFASNGVRFQSKK